MAPGQHEIDFKYSDALDIADKIITFKMVVRTVAQKHGLHATFMAKPRFELAGNGMHMNQSLFKGNENAFWDPEKPDQLSDDALSYVAGVLKHAKAITAITNPTINSYKRLVPGFEAPMYIAWSFQNRSPHPGPAKRDSLRVWVARPIILQPVPGPFSGPVGRFGRDKKQAATPAAL